MAENEKIVPEAEEAKVEAPAEEVKAEAAAPEVKEEKKEEKKPAEKKPLNVKLLSIIAGGAVGLVVIVLLVVALISGGNAISAFKDKDYEGAYKAAKMAWFMNGDDKDTIKVGYIQEVLCKEGLFFEAYELLESTGLSADEKDEVYKKNGNLAMCKPGQIATFGTYDTVPVEWIVLDVEEKKIGGKKHALALLISKDIIGSPAGWGATTVYKDSDLHDFCDITFKNQFLMNLSAEQQNSICSTSISTPEGDVTAFAFAPSKEMMETYFVDDLAEYLAAAPTQGAKMAGVAGPGVSKCASYYLRDIGKKEGETQFACGVNHEGKISDGFSMEQRSIGARVCINVDLGEV